MTDYSIYLSAKRASLSSPGTRLPDIYYTEANSTVSLVENTYRFTQRIGLSSMTFGSSSQILIPRGSLISTMYLHLKLTPIIAQLNLAQGWGYAMISRITWLLGASTSTQISLEGDSILQSLLSQCETSEKREQILALGGQAISTGLSPTVNPDMNAYVVIPTPFSTLCEKLPMDTSMLQNNITLTIDFKESASAIYAGLALASAPSAFLVAEILFRDTNLTDQSKSLANLLAVNADLKYSYPFIHTQSFVSAPFDGVLASSGNTCSQILNGFLNADIPCISFWVIKVADKRGSTVLGARPYNLDNISNVTVILNGDRLFYFPEMSYLLTNILVGGDQQSSIIPTIQMGNMSTGPNFIPQPKSMIFLDFSRLRSTCVHSHFFNNDRLTNQNLTLTFNTTTTDKYILYATYYYNGVVEFGMGSSAILLN